MYIRMCVWGGGGGRGVGVGVGVGEYLSSMYMYNNDVGKKFLKLKGTLMSATLYFTSRASYAYTPP
jgi:hypothetical protein